MHVKLIEIDEARCDEIGEQLPEALSDNGDGTLQDTLCEEALTYRMRGNADGHR